MGGIKTAFMKALQMAMQDPKFNRVFEPTPVNGGGSRAFYSPHIRVDHGEPGTGNRVIQIQSQTSDPTLKKFAQRNGTHTKVAVVRVNELGPNDANAIFEDAVFQASKW